MTAAETPESGRKPARRPRGRPYKNVTDAKSVSMLGIGMIAGAVIGAGIALLMAPQSGVETRRVLGHRADRLRGNTGVWEKLGRELRRAAVAKRKSLELEARRNEIAARAAARQESSVG